MCSGLSKRGKKVFDALCHRLHCIDLDSKGMTFFHYLYVVERIEVEGMLYDLKATPEKGPCPWLRERWLRYIKLKDRIVVKEKKKVISLIKIEKQKILPSYLSSDCVLCSIIVEDPVVVWEENLNSIGEGEYQELNLHDPNLNLTEDGEYQELNLYLSKAGLGGLAMVTGSNYVVDDLFMRKITLNQGNVYIVSDRNKAFEIHVSSKFMFEKKLISEPLLYEMFKSFSVFDMYFSAVTEFSFLDIHDDSVFESYYQEGLFRSLTLDELDDLSIRSDYYFEESVRESVKHINIFEKMYTPVAVERSRVIKYDDGVYLFKREMLRREKINLKMFCSLFMGFTCGNFSKYDYWFLERWLSLIYYDDSTGYWCHFLWDSALFCNSRDSNIGDYCYTVYFVTRFYYCYGNCFDLDSSSLNCLYMIRLCSAMTNYYSKGLELLDSFDLAIKEKNVTLLVSHTIDKIYYEPGIRRNYDGGLELFDKMFLLRFVFVDTVLMKAFWPFVSWVEWSTMARLRWQKGYMSVSYKVLYLLFGELDAHDHHTEIEIIRLCRRIIGRSENSYDLACVCLCY